jgi:hypothetical protein
MNDNLIRKDRVDPRGAVFLPIDVRLMACDRLLVYIRRRIR